MARVLELFSGTGSIGKCCKELGWESISVDLESKLRKYDGKKAPVKFNSPT